MSIANAVGGTQGADSLFCICTVAFSLKRDPRAGGKRATYGPRKCTVRGAGTQKTRRGAVQERSRDELGLEKATTCAGHGRHIIWCDCNEPPKRMAPDNGTIRVHPVVRTNQVLVGRGGERGLRRRRGGGRRRPGDLTLSGRGRRELMLRSRVKREIGQRGRI